MTWILMKPFEEKQTSNLMLQNKTDLHYMMLHDVMHHDMLGHQSTPTNWETYLIHT